MKIYRGGLTNDDWFVTDHKAPKAYAKDWEPGKSIRFDGTIDKLGQRHTVLGVHIDAEDVLALHGALVEHLQNQKVERDKLESDVIALKQVLGRISGLISRLLHSDDENTIRTIEELSEICDYYAYPPAAEGKPYKPKTPDVRKYSPRKWPSVSP